MLKNVVAQKGEYQKNTVTSKPIYIDRNLSFSRSAYTEEPKNKNMGDPV